MKSILALAILLGSFASEAANAGVTWRINGEIYAKSSKLNGYSIRNRTLTVKTQEAEIIISEEGARAAGFSLTELLTLIEKGLEAKERELLFSAEARGTGPFPVSSFTLDSQSKW